jgi:hypothetical protein
VPKINGDSRLRSQRLHPFPLVSPQLEHAPFLARYHWESEGRLETLAGDSSMSLGPTKDFGICVRTGDSDVSDQRHRCKLSAMTIFLRDL